MDVKNCMADLQGGPMVFGGRRFAVIDDSKAIVLGCHIALCRKESL